MQSEVRQWDARSASRCQQLSSLPPCDKGRQMSFMSEIDLAKQQGEKITRMTIHDGRRMSICTACLNMASRAPDVLHASGCPHIVKMTKKQLQAMRKRIKDSIDSRWTKAVVKAPSLVEMARYINQVMGFKVELSDSFSDTDRKI